MRKSLFILLFPTISWAACPQFTYPENHKLDQELNGICNIIRNPLINVASVQRSSITVSTITNLSLGGNENAANFKITSLANGTANSDAATFGQISGQRILQTKSCPGTPNDATTSSTFVNTSTNCSMTPTNSTTKILILASGIGTTANGNTTNGIFTISGTANGNIGGANGLAEVLGFGANIFYQNLTMQIIDTPGTAAQQTYTIQFKSAGGASVNWGLGLNINVTLLEIG